MNTMSRSSFLKISALGLAGAADSTHLLRALSGTAMPDDELMRRVVEHSDQAVTRYLGALDNYHRSRYYRPYSNAFAAFTASYCHPDSSHHRSADLLAQMDTVLSRLLEAQHPNGTMDAGGNRQSPPDTAFFLEQLCPAAAVLRQSDFDETARVREKLDTFLQRAGEAMITGGVHTPNHRWVVAAMLARLYTLYGDDRYLRRMDQWLADGIYQNQDGNYPERSRNYALVENDAFITIGRLLDRPQLFDAVRRNLEATYYYMEPNGDLVALDSRRQDQNGTIPITRFYFLYRFLAIHDNDAHFAGIVRAMDDLAGFDRYVLSELIWFMEEPALLAELPPAAALPTRYTKEFPGSGLVRIRRGATTASIFAGNDLPLQIASGRSNNPTFFTFRKGAAVLRSVRLSTSFFSTGYVRGDGVARDGDRYTITERKEAYYYHPMPADRRDPDGDYTLSPSLDDRFWSKMDFANRPKDTVALESSIVITEEDGAFRMDIAVDGPADVNVTLEFCFQQGGALEGVTPAAGDDDYFLRSGTARYTFGDDTIAIGPGTFAHDSLRNLDGEVYSTHFGTIKGPGMHVYLTGRTPFAHSVTIR